MFGKGVGVGCLVLGVWYWVFGKGIGVGCLVLGV